jgi:hypothetical protein
MKEFRKLLVRERIASTFHKDRFEPISVVAML